MSKSFRQHCQAVAELAEETGLTVDKQLETLRAVICHARAMPVVVDDTPLDFLACLINLSDKKHSPETVTSYSAASALLADEKWFQNVLATIPGLVSHGIKFADARYTGSLFIPQVDDSDMARHYVSSASSWLRKPFDWAGNSAALGRKVLFCTAFSWQGEVLTLTEALARRESVFINGLRELGLSDSQWQQLQQAVDAAVQPRTPTGASYKTLYFPRIDHDDYLLLTPVPSVAMHREIYQRTLSSEQPDSHYYRTRRHRVGESKPQNVGDFYNSVSGAVAMLHGGLFNPERAREDRRQALFLSGRPIWGQLHLIDSEDGKTKVSPFAFMAAEQASGEYDSTRRSWQRQMLAANFYRLLRQTLLVPVLDYRNRYRLGELGMADKHSALHWLVYGEPDDQTPRQQCETAIADELIRQFYRLQKDCTFHATAQSVLSEVITGLVDQLLLAPHTSRQRRESAHGH